MENKRKFSLRKIVYDNRILMVFSLLLAIVIWISVTLYESPQVERTIKNVKVTIDNTVPSQLGYKMFGKKNIYVDVTVKGKRYLIGDNVLKANDIRVTAITGNITTAGEHTLQLKATKANPNADYQIVDISQSTISEYFDVLKEAEYTLTPEINIKSKLVVSDDYMSQTEVLSANKVTISGPATEVNKINKVVASIDIDKPLSATKQFTAKVEALGAYGEPLEYLTINTGNGTDKVTITIPILKKETLPVTANFKNTPLYYIDNPLTFTTSVSTLNVAAQKDVFDEIQEILLGYIDFNQLGIKNNTFEFNVSDISSSLTVLSDVKTITVTVNMDGMSKNTFNIGKSNISLTNKPDGYTAAIAQDSLDGVLVIGPQSDISSLSPSTIYATIDLSGDSITAGAKYYNSVISFKNDNKVWAYGTYKVLVDVEKS